MGIDPIGQRVNFCCTNIPASTSLPQRYLHECFLIALPLCPLLWGEKHDKDKVAFHSPNDQDESIYRPHNADKNTFHYEHTRSLKQLQLDYYQIFNFLLLAKFSWDHVETP